MKKFFNSKLFYIIVALLTSFAIWVYVASNDQDVISKRFDGVRVEFTGEEALLASKGFVIIDPSVNTVSVTLSGPRNVVGLLEPADLTASVDVSKLTQVGYTNLTYSIKFPANTNEANISVRRETPQVISFNLSPVIEKTVPVRGSFDGNTAEGYTAESPVFEPSTITLRGAEALLSDISYAWVTFGEEDISVSYTTDVPFTLMDSKGNECSSTGLTANVETVKATLPILQIKEVALRAVARTFSQDVRRGNSHRRVVFLRTFAHKIDFFWRHFLVVEEVRDTRFPRAEAVENLLKRRLFLLRCSHLSAVDLLDEHLVGRFLVDLLHQRLVGVRFFLVIAQHPNHRNHKDDSQHHDAEQFSELLHRHATQNHHHKHDDAQQGGCREVFDENQRNDEGADEQNIVECVAVGTFLGLHRAQNLRGRQDERSLRNFRGLELQKSESHPASRLVGLVAADKRPQQHHHRNNQQKRRDNLEIFAFHVERHNHTENAQNQDADVLHHGRQIASSLIRQLRRSRIHLDHADDAQEEKDHPDDLVALENII